MDILKLIVEIILVVGSVVGWISSYKAMIAKPVKKASVEKSIFSRYFKITFTYVVIVLFSFFIFVLSKDILETAVKIIY